jgi:HEAT repeat protein
MRRKRMLSKKVILALSVLLGVLAACAPGATATPSSTDQLATAVAIIQTATARAIASPTPTTVVPVEATVTLTPSVGPTLAPPAIQAAGWEGVTVHTLCLELEQSYPGIERDTHICEATAETTERILTGLGLGVVAEGASCEATLAMSATGEAVGAHYSGEALFPGDSGEALGPDFTSGYCYTGAEVRGEVTLSAVGRDTLTLSVEARHDPPGAIHGCPVIPEGAPFEEVWVDAMLSPDGVVRQLWGVPGLVQALGDEDADVRQGAASALGQIGPEAAQAVPALIEALGDQDEDVRERAASALGQIGAEAVAALIEALGDEDADVRQGAALALGQIGAEAARAVPALIQALGDEDADVRRGAALGLAGIGPEAARAVPALIEALGDEDADVRQGAALALGQIGPEAAQAVPALIELLGDEELLVSSGAALALGDIGPEAAQAVPALIEALAGEYGRWAALAALKGITGQDFGEDAEAWQEWWESQQ